MDSFPHPSRTAARLIQVKACAWEPHETAGMACCLDTALCCRDFTVEDDVVAHALGLALDAFRRLMDQHRITVRCEGGSGEDEGLYRATFYYGPQYAKLLVDGGGHMVAPVAADEG
jgi:hypothetical protein